MTQSITRKAFNLDKKRLIDLATANIDILEADLNKYGGPFGAVIVDKDYNVVGAGWNTVIKDNDPTAHAEVNAIRNACDQLGTFDLEGCTLIATGYPCPMCLSAIMWANIVDVYYVADVKEAERIGFRDEFIYETIERLRNGDTTKFINLKHLKDKRCKKRMHDIYTIYDEIGKMY